LIQVFGTQYSCLDLIPRCMSASVQLSMHYYDQVTLPFKIVPYTLTQCSHVLNVQFSPMKLQVYTSCSCVCCYFGFFTACRFLSCTVPRRRFCSSLIDCQCWLSHLIFFTLQTFVCRRLSKDLSIGRIGCTQPFRQFPRHGDSGVPSLQMVYFVLICPRCSSYSCSLLGLNWELLIIQARLYIDPSFRFLGCRELQVPSLSRFLWSVSKPRRPTFLSLISLARSWVIYPKSI
jgi:hypothetical protein